MAQMRKCFLTEFFPVNTVTCCARELNWQPFWHSVHCFLMLPKCPGPSVTMKQFRIVIYWKDCPLILFFFSFQYSDHLFEDLKSSCISHPVLYLWQAWVVNPRVERAPSSHQNSQSEHWMQVRLSSDEQKQIQSDSANLSREVLLAEEKSHTCTLTCTHTCTHTHTQDLLLSRNLWSSFVYICTLSEGVLLWLA